MIRREATDDAGPAWVLVSQIDHARLSGRLAEHWGAPPFARLEPTDEIVAAVHHHDDGWAEWERAPGVDARSGRPLDFTEMPPDEALAIWRASIDAAARIGHLAAWMVSGHFSALLRRSTQLTVDSDTRESNTLIIDAQDSNARDEAAQHGASLFLAEQETLRNRHLAAWIDAGPSTNTVQRAERALGWLQMFDWLSLWLCCAERSTPLDVQPPVGPLLTLRPAGSGRIHCSPWPFTVGELSLEAPGRRVPATRYADEAALAAAAAPYVTLRWTAVPASD